MPCRLSRPRWALFLGVLLGLAPGCLAGFGGVDYEPGIRRDVATLASFGSRVAGYPGAAQAEAYVRERLEGIGLTDITEQEFDLVSPVDKGSSLTLASGETVPLHAVWPNLVVGSTVVPDGTDAPLVYGGGGTLEELDGLPLDGSIVLLDFNCGTRWLNAAMLGAKAVIFLEPEETTRQDASEKCSRVPVDFPRFYLTKADGAALLSRVREASPGSVTGALESRVEWQEVAARTFLAGIPGSDPMLARETIVLQAYYDSMSVVPGIAPGAEQACGIAGFLAIAEALVANPPGRSVLLVASPGHFMGMAGMRNLADVLGPKGRSLRDQQQAYRLQRNEGQKAIARLETGLSDTRLTRDKIRQLAASTTAEDVQRYQLEMTDRGEVDFEREIARTERQVGLLRQNLDLMERLSSSEHIPLTISLDLTSHSRQFGLAFCGHYFGDAAPIRFLSPLGKEMTRVAEGLASERGWDATKLWFDGANPKQEKNWWDYFPGRIGFESEMILAAGRPAITLATGGDNRPVFDTPLDTAEQVDVASVAFQSESIAEMLYRFCSDPELDKTAFKRTKRVKLPYKLQPQVGRVLEFVRRSSFLPQTPIPGSLVLIRGASKSLMGVRTDLMTIADGAGYFRLQGHQNGATVDAYYLDPTMGRVRYAPDLGPEGDRKFSRSVALRGRQDRPVILFPCESLSLFDLVDQRYLQTLERVYVYDAKTNAEPLSYGYEVPLFAPPAGETGVSVEPCAVVFAEKGQSVKIALGMGLLGARMLLLNADETAPEGRGFVMGERDRVPFTVLRAARDMSALDGKRISDFVTKGVKDPQVEMLHAAASERLGLVDGHLGKREYAQAASLARAAWAYESSAYPNVQKTARDVVYGVVFYLALLLTFTYFAERLLVSAARVPQRVAWTVGIFGVVFLLLYLVHPAFDLAVNPLIILLAFIILALAVIVVGIVVGKFNEQLERLKQELGGIHKADMSRISAAGMAFSLGVANMRRRRTRTALTCVTLVLVTFTVLSFSSVRSGVRINRIARPGTPSYSGIMVRDKVWVQLEDTIPEVMRNEWGDRYVVSPRAWVVSSDITKRGNYDLARYGAASLPPPPPPAEGATAPEPGAFTVHALLGVSEHEPKVSGLDQRLLPGGRWFRQDDHNACILPASVAEGLGITPEDVARWQRPASDEAVSTVDAARTASARLERRAAAFGDRAPLVALSGSWYEVIGVIPDEDLTAPVEGSDRGFLDLDGETVLPVDFSQLKPEVLQLVREMTSQRFRLGRGGLSSLVQEYQHYTAAGVMLLPYTQCIRLGGTTRSVAIGIPTPEETDALVNQYMQRLAVSLYATGADETGARHIYLLSSIGSKSLDGAETLLVPILIAALIVLNTMLGSVWERVREIHVFSSVGLSPTHVGALFLAESCVYANVGAIVGYLIGQGLTKVLLLTGNLGPVQTNYSSLAAVFSTVVVLVTVLLSTLWPARKAAQIAVPDIERRWRLPEPEGDRMAIRLPFTVTGRDAPASNAFLLEFFEAYMGYAGGEFLAEDVRLEPVAREHGTGYILRARVWLAPYDLGVSQSVEMRSEPTGEHRIFELHLALHRESGDVSSWKKTNWLFLNLLRKQFLIWRTIPAEHKEVYARRALALGEEEAAPRS